MVERIRGTRDSSALGLVFAATVLVFQPTGLDQFLLPKTLVLLVGAPLMLGFLVSLRGASFRRAGDSFLVASVAIFFLWSAVAPAGRAANPLLHARGGLEAAAMVIVFFSAFGVRRQGKRAERTLLWFLALPAIVVALLAVTQAFAVDPLRLLFDLESTRPARWQVLTTLGNPTWTAELILLSLPFVLVLSTEAGVRGRWLLRGAALLSVVAIGVTGSRGALLGLIIVAVGAWRFGLLPRTEGRRPFVRAATLGLFSAFAIVAVGAVGPQRLGDLKAVSGRLGLWAAGAHLLADRPMTGWGLGATQLILPEGLETVVEGLDPDRHRWLPTVLVDRLDQDLLQVAVERGLPAAFLLLFLATRALALTFARARRAAAVGGAGVIFLAAFLLLSVFSAPFHTAATAMMFWIVLGLVAGGEGGDPETEAIGPVRWVGPVAGAVAAGLVALFLAAPVVKMNALAGDGHREIRNAHFEAAAKILRPMDRPAPWFAGASIDRARALVELDRAAEALVVLADVEPIFASEWIWATRARALDRLGLEREARGALEEAFAVLPYSPVLCEARVEITR